MENNMHLIEDLFYILATIYLMIKISIYFKKWWRTWE
jgi:hypothetical protein